MASSLTRVSGAGESSREISEWQTERHASTARRLGTYHLGRLGRDVAGAHATSFAKRTSARSQWLLRAPFVDIYQVRLRDFDLVEARKVHCRGGRRLCDSAITDQPAAESVRLTASERRLR